MNPQPPEYMGQIIAAIIGVMVLYYAIKAFYDDKQTISTDLFTLGYIEDSKDKIIVVQNRDKQNLETQQLFIDCIDALHALGMKKNEAKKRARHIFNSASNSPSSVQEFLMIALRNN